MIPLSYCKY